MRPVRRFHQALGGLGADDGLGGKRVVIGRAGDAGDVVGMKVGEHDHARLVERLLQLGEGLGEIRLALVGRGEGIVRFLVEPGIDHHRAVRIDHLEGGARHGDGRVVTAFE